MNLIAEVYTADARKIYAAANFNLFWLTSNYTLRIDYEK